MAFPILTEKKLGYRLFSIDPSKEDTPARYIDINRIPITEYNVQGKVITPTTLVYCFKSRVIDRINYMRKYNTNDAKHNPLHEFLSDITLVNFDGVMYTEEDSAFLESPISFKTGPVTFPAGTFGANANLTEAYTPQDILGNPVVSEILDESVFHKNRYSPGAIDQLGADYSLIKRVYDVASKSLTGEVSDVIDIENTLNALSIIVDNLSCVRVLEMYYLNAQGQPINATENPSFSIFDRLHNEFFTDQVEKSNRNTPLIQFLAILDPHYKKTGILDSYMVSGDILSQENLFKLFDKVACDLLNHIFNGYIEVLFVANIYSNSYRKTKAWKRLFGRNWNSYVYWNAGGDVPGGTCFYDDLPVNGRTKKIKGIRLSLYYESGRSAWVGGAWVRCTGVNKATGQEDDYGKFEFTTTRGQSLVLWHPVEWTNHLYTEDLFFTKPIPLSHVFRIYLHSAPGSGHGDSFGLHRMTLEDIYYEDE